MTDESPDTEEQLTSQDFIKEGPIERGIQSHAEAFMAEPSLSMHPADAHAVMTKLGARADMFKAMAFEADRNAKRLAAQVATLTQQVIDEAATNARYRSALLDIEWRVATWRDSHWFEAQEPGNMQASVMLAILAVVRRIK